MARLSGNVGLKDVGQTQATQGAQKGGFKGFMMSIGQGLARAGHAIAHFFGTSVPSFFKNLSQRNAVAVTTTDKPRSMSLGDEAKTSDDMPEMKMSTVEVKSKTSTETSEAKWSSAKFEVKTSGNGGVVKTVIGKTTIALKGGGGLTGNEVLGARLAQTVGLSAPTTRMLTEAEKTNIEEALDKKGVEMPPRRFGGPEATMVIDWVDGELLGTGDVNPKDAKALAKSLGEWMAFDAVIFEKDRFSGLNPNGSGNGINTGNFLVSPKKPGEIVGIDQTVMPGDSSKYINSIRRGDDSLFQGIAYTLSDKFDMDPEELKDIMKQGAQTKLREIGNTLTDTKIDELSSDLTFASNVTNDLKSRAALART